jgi:hemoglobin
MGCAEGQKTNPLPSVHAPPVVDDPAKALAPIQKEKLYDRLGGAKAVIKVVDDFVANVIADPKIRPVHKKHFEDENIGVLKKKLIDQIGEATGGPQKYTGKSMKDAHKGLDITNADFDALIANVRKALDDNKAAAADRDELLKMLEGMRLEVVERKD